MGKTDYMTPDEFRAGVEEVSEKMRGSMTETDRIATMWGNIWREEGADMDEFYEADRLAEIRVTDDADYERFCASREAFERYMRAVHRRYESEIDELRREVDALTKRLTRQEAYAEMVEEE